MKKIIFFSAFAFASVITNAQTVKLKKGQVLTVSRSISSEVDMGMAGQLNNSTKSTSIIEVKETGKDSYKATSKLSKMSMSIDAMGQEQSFDSEKPEDMQGEMGQELGKQIGKDINVTIENSTGKVTAETKKESPEREVKEEDPMSALFNMAGDNANEGGTAESVIYILPAGKKAGDSWVDSSEIKDKAKIYKTYTVKSLQNEIATINIVSKSSSKNNVEANGMQLEMAMDMKGDAEMIVDTKTSIVKKITRTINIDGTMEVMGQSIPVTSKTTELTEVN